MPETHHTLRDYLTALDAAHLLASHTIGDSTAGVSVTHLSYDSRDVEPGPLFICKGAHFRASFLTDALRKGAVAYVAAEDETEALARADEAIAKAPRILVTDIRAALVVLADTGFDHVPNRLAIAGVTGTKGKSTTTYYLRAILDDYLESIGKPACAYLSSIDNYDGISTEEAHLTTPEVLELYRHLQNAVDSGITHVAMEVSSQSLMTGRVNGITFDVGAWLNIDIDHISPIEHASFEDYFAAKLLLFDRCKVGCVNTDAAHADEVLAYARQRCPVITFGHHESDDISCRRVERRSDGIAFQVVSETYNGEFLITMPGLFNVENALCAMAMARVLGIPEDSVRRGLAKGRAAGRMQVYASRDGQVSVIVDYAHNRLSFSALLSSTEAEYPGHKII
ncbi:MAG: UDP-N-acetylmuramyl peptide synthase, partial [Eggerthellaceae bacterium]|nr:UDP-N-acetylmuramyl peptide synthase [Eggerthellaceae bacterium]